MEGASAADAPPRLPSPAAGRCYRSGVNGYQCWTAQLKINPTVTLTHDFNTRDGRENNSPFKYMPDTQLICASFMPDKTKMAEMQLYCRVSEGLAQGPPPQIRIEPVLSDLMTSSNQSTAMLSPNVPVQA